MNSNHDKIRQIFSEKDGQLPPELEWDQMEAGILEKMKELEPPKESSRRFFWKKNTIFGLSVAVIILLIPIFCTQTLFKTNDQALIGLENQPLLEHSDKAEVSQSVSSKSNEYFEKENESKKEQINKNSDKKAISKVSKSMSTLKSMADNLVLSEGKEKPYGVNQKGSERRVQESKNGVLSKSSQKSQSVPLLVLGSEQSLQEKSVSMLEKEEESKNVNEINEEGKQPFTPVFSSQLNKAFVQDSILNGQKSLRDNTPALTIASKGFLLEADPVITSTIPQRAFVSEMPDLKRINDFGRLSLLGGVSFWNMGYGANKPQRNAFESPLISYYGQLNYQHSLKNNFIAMIGFQFQHLESFFEWETLLEQAVTLTDVVVEIQVNALTGEKKEILGEVEVPVSATRTIRYYNKTQLYQIPFAIGKTWSSKKWQADFLIGSALNIYSKNQGRTLYDGEIQIYNHSSTDFLSNQWKLHAMVSSQLSYHLNDSFGLMMSVQLQRSLNNWSKETNTIMKPNTINLGIGLNYSM